MTAPFIAACARLPVASGNIVPSSPAIPPVAALVNNPLAVIGLPVTRSIPALVAIPDNAPLTIGFVISALVNALAIGLMLEPENIEVPEGATGVVSAAFVAASGTPGALLATGVSAPGVGSGVLNAPT